MIARMKSQRALVLQGSTWVYMIALVLTLSILSTQSYGAEIRSAIDGLNGAGTDGSVSVIDSPRRAGTKALRHNVPNGGNRAEALFGRVALGGTYWYGWSFRHPSSPGVPSGGWTILAQWFVGGRDANSWPCGGAGHKLTINSGTLKFNLQHSTTGGSNITCKTYELASFDDIKDKWVDVVINAKWTANTDGFVKLWIRIGGDSGQWVQKINYTGRSQADGDRGPYLKWGAYTDKKGPRVVYTDEVRVHDSRSSFNDVAPGAGGGPIATPTPTVETLIDETFVDSASVSDFTTSGGSWNVSNGLYQLTNAINPCSLPLCNMAMHSTNVSGDFTLTAQVGAVSTSGTWDDTAVIFGYQDANNYYFASFNESNDAGTNGIFKVVNGTKTQIADFSATTNSGTTLRSIKIERVGNSIRVSRDGTSLGTVDDSTYTSGKVGIGAFNNNANFDNFKVTKP
jgi:hypothetical protein